MIILLIFLIYPLVVTVTLLVLNDKCLLPGTSNYRYHQLQKKEAFETERSRNAVIRARYIAAENEQLDKQQLQLTT